MLHSCDMFDEYREKLSNAPVYDIAIKTPLEKMSKLSKHLGNRIHIKREDLQPVFSFKCRGAYTKMASLKPSQRENGVVAASAGNHAQGVALSAKKYGIKATIVMPETTPTIKVTSVKNYGAKVILHGDKYDDAKDYALELCKETKQTFIHPYDDPEVIAGQGTVGVELLTQIPKETSAIFIPCGGGGLISGVALAIKEKRPDIKIISVESRESGCLYEALKHNERRILQKVGIFADGIAVKQIGEEPFRIAKKYVDETLLVSTDEICAAIKDIYDESRSIAEPAGAAGLAGLKQYIKKNNLKNQTLITINSGANINFDRFRFIAERAETGEEKEGFIAVEIPEKPGSFLRFCKSLGKRAITEFNYRYNNPGKAMIFVGLALRKGFTEKDAIISKLNEKNYTVTDLTDNELAKIHICHMVGGKALRLNNERVFRAQFPERPGALLEFLTVIGKHWNISLFHYRNYGSDYGRVLVGFQVLPEQETAFNSFKETLPFPLHEETNNPAYRLFL